MRKASASAAGVALRVQVAPHRLCQLKVVGGFLDGACFDFTSGLNCIIGARGTGKTTVLELVRYGLDITPDPEADPEAARRIASVVENNLKDGRVILRLQTPNGLTYTVSRAAGEAPLVLTSDGMPTQINVRASGIFPADIFSQNQIERIADETLWQLSLIDNFEPCEVAQINGQLRALLAKLAANAGAIMPLEEERGALVEEIAGLPAVEEKLGNLPALTGELAEAVRAGQIAKSLRQREAQAFGALWEFLTQYDAVLEQAENRFSAELADLFTQEMLDGPNGPAISDTLQRLTQAANATGEHLKASRRVLAESQDHLTDVGTAWQARHGLQEAQFQALLAKNEAIRVQATERGQLDRLRNELLEKRRKHEAVTEKVAGLRSERSKMLEELSELRDRRFGVRQRVVQKINDSLEPTIRVRLEQCGHVSAYRDMLEAALRGGRLKHGNVSQRLVERLSPLDLVGLVRDGCSAALRRRVGLSDEQARKVLDALDDPSTLFALEVLELADRPIIELRDGRGYKPSGVLSTGQKCTTILPILLMDRQSPLLIDQPEDNLDNRFVCESVVESIRKAKGQRQLIFVTHNPNIPVLGEAERIFVLESDGTRAQMVAAGDVDTCKDAIVNLLEGGEEAFRQRQERYAYA